MLSLKHGFGFLLVFAVAALFVGCTPTLPTEYVEGVVTVDGEPVEGAIVVFTPANEGQGLSATGNTDAEGKYTLTVIDPPEEQVAVIGGGTTPGSYKISVMKRAEVEQPMTEEEAEEAGVEYVEVDSYAETENVYIVPEKYENHRTSGLTADVVAGNNNIPLDLTSE